MRSGTGPAKILKGMANPAAIGGKGINFFPGPILTFQSGVHGRRKSIPPDRTSKDDLVIGRRRGRYRMNFREKAFINLLLSLLHDVIIVAGIRYFCAYFCNISAQLPVQHLCYPSGVPAQGII